MDDDWDVEDTPVQSGSSNPLAPNPVAAKPAAAPVSRAPARGKWEGEDDDEDGDDDWDKSEDEKPKPKATTAAPPAKKKMSLKAKLEEKERLAREKALNGDDDDDLMPTMTEQERRRLAREREIEADMENANELFGAASLDDASGTNTPSGVPSDIFTDKPKSKEDFAKLSKKITESVIARHASNPLFPAFIEAFAKDICEGLNAVQTRKVSSALSVLGNTKQAEERDKASGKKKAAAKPKLGGAKTMTKVDTDAYDDVLDDDDFM